jgi:pyruvate/2-oxoglutarate dehydrogenase complex dihydrolipoamide acyltransferase (E2) component
MKEDVLMPQLGETVAEGKILAWFRAVGDEVKLGDRLFEVETDKVTIDVEAVAAGRISEILVGEGAVAKVGAVVGVITDAPNAAAAAEPKPNPRLKLGSIEEVATPLAYFASAKGFGDISVSPLARRLIDQNNLDMADVAKPVLARNERRIVAADVRAALATPRTGAAERPAALATKAGLGEATPLSGIRQKTAERLTENWRSIPHVFQAIEIDFTNVEAVRASRKDAFRAANGAALTYLSFIARATCLALHEFPRINARFDGRALTLVNGVNLGIAVDLSHDGLVVPVVRNADVLTVTDLAKAIGRQIEKARANKLTADDFADGSYTITNNGAFGTLFTAPIINAPQVAILSTDAIRKKPALVETPEGDFIAPRLIGVVVQSFDHRAFDGAYSAAFLSKLKSVLERRTWIDEFKTGD